MSSKFLLSILLLFSLSTLAQTVPSTANLPAQPATKRVYRDTVPNTDPSLNGQYRFMLSRTRTSSDGYKLVNPNRLSNLWKNVEDSLKKARADKKALNRKMVEQEKTISYLKTEMSGKEASLNERKDQINEISFLGISFDKGTYSLIVWSIIGVLAAALAFVISKSASKIAEAKHRTELYEEIANEYQAYKTKAVEKERKLARELQDERNKIDEMKNGRI